MSMGTDDEQIWNEVAAMSVDILDVCRRTDYARTAISSLNASVLRTGISKVKSNKDVQDG
jgi:hypothetical protein